MPMHRVVVCVPACPFPLGQGGTVAIIVTRRNVKQPAREPDRDTGYRVSVSPPGAAGPRSAGRQRPGTTRRALAIGVRRYTAFESCITSIFTLCLRTQKNAYCTIYRSYLCHRQCALSFSASTVVSLNAEEHNTVVRRRDRARGDTALHLL